MKDERYRENPRAARDFESVLPKGDEKHVARVRLRTLRASIPEEKRAKYSKQIETYLYQLDEVSRASSFFIYVSCGSEVDTHSLIRRLQENDKIVAVPKIMDSNTMEAIRFKAWQELRPAVLGILTPTASEPYQGPIDIAITPGLGFTPSGQRLGQGRGYYDQWFATHTVNLKIALAYEAQIVDHLPTDATDIPVDVILTERRTIRVARDGLHTPI
ncbi:MAG: 5-formyltetrahydrofolate cyclo-ligase [Gammaproteobacteria bacterium]|nr:5-formyltetrahydrofolate cyclo-ligase [Gammaproteobacteria bacterium]MCI0590207.1 5-formyltetrahydrofolate cyclo-ligase [Gammaproteobacteria bacterium]